jgi:glycolate oxidase iron-sulfur subunit
MSPQPSPLAARIATLADACVLCGLCLPHCPTYRLDRREPESPRGRIMHFKALAEDRLAPEPSTLAALDHCLACRECERVCPAQVRYGELLLAGREWQRERVAPGWRQRALEWLLPRPRAVRFALAAAGLLQAWLPGPWRRLPRVPRPRSIVPRDADAQVRGRVALFSGCLGRHYEADALDAAARVLARLGYAVEIATTPTCCRAVEQHAGVSPVASPGDADARVPNDAPVLAVLTLSSGCHESLARARGAGSAPVVDLFAFLDADPAAAHLRFRAASADLRVACHLPCTQRNVLRNDGRIAAWLARIDGLALQPLDRGCCGAAGSHMLIAPARAAALRAPVLDAIQAGAATTLCSSNVGCRMHLAAGLEARGATCATRHPIQLLADHLDD